MRKRRFVTAMAAAIVVRCSRVMVCIAVVATHDFCIAVALKHLQVFTLQDLSQEIIFDRLHVNLRLAVAALYRQISRCFVIYKTSTLVEMDMTVLSALWIVFYPPVMGNSEACSLEFVEDTITTRRRPELHLLHRPLCTSHT